MKEQKIKKLSDVEHLLVRPNTYIGSITNEEVDDWLLEENIFKYKKYSYIQAFNKIINEILDNCVDEYTRTNGEYSTKIKVEMDKTSVTIIDNGRGLPTDLIEVDNEKIFPLELAFTHAKSGSNFEDDNNRETIGMNGVGSFATNVFSKKFIVDSCYYKTNLNVHLECTNNLSTKKTNNWKKQEHGTKVYFEPDLNRFGLNEIEPIYFTLMRQRLYILSIIYPKIYFSFNKEYIKCHTYKDLIKSFGNEIFDYYETENYFIGLSPNNSDDFKFFTILNGLILKNGGTHLNFIMDQIITTIKDKNKKYNIQSGEIKNKLFPVIIFKNFKNMKFDSQTKDKLTNSLSEIKQYLNNDYTIQHYEYFIKDTKWDNFLKRVSTKTEFIDPIIEMYKIKEEFKNRQELKKVTNNSGKKIIVENYLPPIDNKKYLVLGEGTSATNGILKVLGRKDFGYFPLRGKSLNVLDLPLSKIVQNEELMNIMKILNITIGDSSNMSYDSVLITSDSDFDGILIRSLLLTFFHKFFPELIKKGKIKYLITPMIILFDDKKIPQKWFFNFGDYNSWIKENQNHKYSTKYYKGLGTFTDTHLKYIFEKENFNNFLEIFEYDESSEKMILDWMSKTTSDVRKEYLRGKECDIFKA